MLLTVKNIYAQSIACIDLTLHCSNQLLLLLHRLNLLQQQTRLLVNLIILQHGLLTTNIVSSMAFKQSHPLPRLLHQRSQLPLLPRTQQLQLLLSVNTSIYFTYFGPRVYPKGSLVIALVRVSVCVSVRL